MGKRTLGRLVLSFGIATLITEIDAQRRKRRRDKIEELLLEVKAEGVNIIIIEMEA